MATDLATPSNTLAKVRWHEKYVSDGINRKFNGVIPAGVVRGGRLGTSLSNLSVTIEADPVTGDSVYSYINANGQQVTFRQVGDVTLDLSALVSTVVFIGLEITYVISADTVVKWRAFSQAEIDADPNLVVLGMVDVPAAGLIPAGDIYPTERREAWTTIAPHIREWRNPITNGSFETCLQAVLTGATDDYFPDWDVAGSFGLFTGVTVSVVTGNARTGERSLQTVLSGAASERMQLYWAGQLKVFAGQLMSASVWVQGSSLLPGPGANGIFGLAIEFLTRTGASAGVEYISDLTLSGTFGWTEIEGIVEVPSNAVSAWVSVYYLDDNQNSTGTITFDDVRVFLETGRSTDEYPGDGRDDHFGGSLRALSLDLPPQPPAPADIDDLVSEIVRLKQTTKASGILQLLMGARDGTTPFRLQMVDGQLRLVGNNDAAGALRPRIETESTPTATEQYTLLWETPSPDSNALVLRMYHGTGGGSYDGWLLTVNAFWDGSQWDRDFADDSMMLEISENDLYVRRYDSGNAAPWGGWDTLGSFTTGTAVDRGEISVAEATITRAIEALGSALIGIQDEDAAIPRINMEMADFLDGRYTCLAEFVPDSITFPQALRLYVCRLTDQNYEAPRGPTFIITHNARWNADSTTPQWVKDVTSEPANRFDFGGDSTSAAVDAGFSWYHFPAGTAGPFDDIDWQDGPGVKLFGFDNTLADEKVRQVLEDGQILFLNTSSGVATGSNPATSDYVKNMLCAKNTVKAFARLGAVNKTIGPIEVGFNFASFGFVTGGSDPGDSYYYLDFDVAFPTDRDDYCAVITVGTSGFVAGRGYFARIWEGNSTASRICWKVYDNNNADLTGLLTCDFHVIVMGQMTG